MSRHLYTLLFYLLLPGIFIRLLWRSRNAPEYARRWPERLGFFEERPKADGIWVHAVSVGETVAAIPLVSRLQQQYPDLPITVTTMTPTGSERVRAVFGDRVFHIYVPYDLPGAVSRFLRRVKPRLVVIMETELWPNLIDQCRRRSIPVIVANARLSERSARGYARLLPLVKPALQSLDLVAAQYLADGQRFRELGLVEQQLSVTGNIKFDIELCSTDLEQAQSLRDCWGLGLEQQGRPVLIASSTHRGEEEVVLDAFEQLRTKFDRLLLILVPRHPERFHQVAALCQARHLNLLLRSARQPCTTHTDVLLGDTMGELPLLYGLADIAFVGGSLVGVGGHNMLEAAAWELPIITGPHLFNFSEVARLLNEQGASSIVNNSAELAERVEYLLSNRAARLTAGQAALRVLQLNRGSLQRLLQLVEVRL